MHYTDFEYLNNVGKGNGFELNEKPYRSRAGENLQNLTENDELESLGFSIMEMYFNSGLPWNDTNRQAMKSAFLMDHNSISSFLKVRY